MSHNTHLNQLVKKAMDDVFGENQWDSQTDNGTTYFKPFISNIFSNYTTASSQKKHGITLMEAFGPDAYDGDWIQQVIAFAEVKDDDALGCFIRENAAAYLTEITS